MVQLDPSTPALDIEHFSTTNVVICEFNCTGTATQLGLCLFFCPPCRAQMKAATFLVCLELVLCSTADAFCPQELPAPFTVTVL